MKTSTKELTEELLKRDGIRYVDVAPYEEFKVITGQGEIVDTGPVTIILNRD